MFKESLPSTALVNSMESAVNHARAKAEMAIEQVLKDLEYVTMLSIAEVSVLDGSVEITFRGE